jgi:hypothetical protein
MLDVHNQLGILSKGYQSNTLVIFDISKNLNRTLRALEELKKEESWAWRMVRYVGCGVVYYSNRCSLLFNAF